MMGFRKLTRKDALTKLQSRYNLPSSAQYKTLLQKMNEVSMSEQQKEEVLAEAKKDMRHMSEQIDNMKA
eukprot:scaffold191339_cov48-Prasinocladus_malaysianus.AAC.1